MPFGVSHQRLLRSPRRPRALALAFAATCLALAAFASASSAELSGFSTPVKLSEGSGFDPQVAVAPGGRATVVWDGGRIKAVRLDAGGNPDQVRRLSPQGQRAESCPDIAVDPAGRALVTWWSGTGPSSIDGRIHVVRLDATGSPEPVHTLSSARVDTTCPRVAVDPDGRATVAWLGDENGSCANRVVQAVRLDPAGTPGPVQTLSRYSDACDSNHPPEPEVAVDGEGRATIVWERWGDGFGVGFGVKSVRLDAAGNPGPILALSDADHAAQLGDVAVDAAGRATVVWFFSHVSNRTVQTVQIDAAGNPGPVQTLANAGRYAQVAVDAEGRATIAWHVRSGVRAVRLDAAGNPGPVETFTQANRIADNPEVAVDPDGRATLVWRSRRDQRPRRTARVHAVQFDPPGTPAVVHTVGSGDSDSHADFPEVAVGPDGRATVVWEGASNRVEAAHSLRLFEVDGSWTRLTLSPGKKRVRYYVRAYNRDTEPSGRLRLCVSAPENRLEILGGRCEAFDDVRPGGWAEHLVKLKILKRARGKLTRVEAIARGPNVRAQRSAWLRVRRRRAPPDPYPYTSASSRPDTSGPRAGEQG
jgi:hypothetical protein